jgi:hypothetical protein
VRTKSRHHGFINEAPEFLGPLVALHLSELVPRQALVPLFHQASKKRSDQYVQLVVYQGIARWNSAKTSGHQLETSESSRTFGNRINKKISNSNDSAYNHEQSSFDNVSPFFRPALTTIALTQTAITSSQIYAVD